MINNKKWKFAKNFKCHAGGDNKLHVNQLYLCLIALCIGSACMSAAISWNNKNGIGVDSVTFFDISKSNHSYIHK